MFLQLSRKLMVLCLICAMFFAATSALAEFDEIEDIPDNNPENTEEPAEEQDEPEEPTEPEKLMTLRPPVQTCPELTDGVSIFGYGFNTQCRRVGGDGVGREDVIVQGFSDAVDIWSVVSSRVELCFHNGGYLVFLDAAYAPRKLMPLLSFERNGMTCGQIDRAGTVVLLSDPMQLDQPIVPPDPVPPDPVETSSIPPDNCLIKLVETLFLRAEPDGEIIGLVWQNSEVPVLEANGDWYKIEFEGKTGYISRSYRKVLRGDCD